MIDDNSTGLRDVILCDREIALPISCFEFTCPCRGAVIVTNANGLTNVTGDSMHLLPFNQTALHLSASMHLEPDFVAQSTVSLLRYAGDVTGRDVFRCRHCLASLATDMTQELADARAEEEWRMRLLSVLPDDDDLLASLETGLSENIDHTSSAPMLDDLLAELEQVAREIATVTREVDDAEVVLDNMLAIRSSERDAAAHAAAARGVLLDARRGAARREAALLASVAALSSTSALVEAFQIAPCGAMTGINGHRLGRTAAVDVPAIELNAALGHAAHLVHVLSNRLAVTHNEFAIQLCGSVTSIEARERHLLGRPTLGLYFGTSGLFARSSLDSALAALTSMVAKLVNAAAPAPPDAESAGAQTGIGDSCPCSVDKDKLNGFSVRAQDAPHDSWTRAMRYLCVVMQWLVGRVVLMTPQSHRPRTLVAPCGPWAPTAVPAE